MSSRLRILFWHMAEANSADTKREQLKSGSILRSNGTRVQQTHRDPDHDTKCLLNFNHELLKTTLGRLEIIG